MSAATTRVRLDELLVQRGHAASREKARALVLAGRVAIGGVGPAKPGRLVSADAALEVRPAAEYVSRGGLKLAHALARFQVEPRGRVCADIGASTGGFTDCLLQRGAARVYAIDVGYGQLAWSLRTDPRVIVMDRTNARSIEALPDAVTLTTVDVSFISLRTILPAIARIAARESEIVALVKPQFEAGKARVGKGGVVRDPSIHHEVLSGLSGWFLGAGYLLLGLVPSPLRGAAGNVEFLAHLRQGEITRADDPGPGRLVQVALDEAQELFPAGVRRTGERR